MTETKLDIENCCKISKFILCSGPEKVKEYLKNALSHSV